MNEDNGIQLCAIRGLQSFNIHLVLENGATRSLHIFSSNIEVGTAMECLRVLRHLVGRLTCEFLRK